MLSRWENGQVDGERQEDGQHDGEGSPNVLVCVVVDEHIWNKLYDGYMGLRGMLHRRRNWSLDVSKRVLEDKLKGCEICAQNQRTWRNTKLGSLNDSSKPDNGTGMDFDGPVSGKYILVTIDFLSRRVQLELCESANGDAVLRSLRIWAMDCGPLKKLVSDQGAHFNCRGMRECCRKGGVE